jgi:hypothetical protein
MTRRVLSGNAVAWAGLSSPSLAVKASFNTTGARASIGRIVRAAVVVGASVALLLAVMASLGKARAGHDDMPRFPVTLAHGVSLSMARHLAARADTTCLPGAIKAALTAANAACGITVISTRRPGARIAGTGRPSMHASCRAADFTSRDYGCVYRVLAGWPGKLSTDARRIGHVHIDDGRRARFAHGQARKRVRLARHNGRRG